ncbi:hypothetical protein HYV84_06240 [Candidatus Woesearchaeota archaeon]|nr:hypothetical protein [Candidatus Woesearchaeota archaeon]
MASSLVNYVKTQFAAGYSNEQLKAYLLQYHYTPAQIEDAFHEASLQAREQKTIARPSKEKIAIAVAVGLSVLLIAGFGIYHFSGKKIIAEPVSLSVSLEKTSYKPGEQVSFSLAFDGGAPEDPASLMYEIKNIQDEVVGSQADEASLKGGLAGRKSIPLKNDLAGGRYYLKVSLSAGGQSISKTASFQVEEKPTLPTATSLTPRTAQQCPPTCDDNNACTKDTCGAETNFACAHETLSPCCGDGTCQSSEDYRTCLADCTPPDAAGGDDLFRGKSIFETIDTIREVAKSDYSRAVSYCQGIEVLSYQHRCLEGVAAGSGNKEACEQILDQGAKDDCYFSFATQLVKSEECAPITRESRRDQCYMEFVMKGDYTVCNNIINKYLKQSCDSMKQLSHATR